MRIPNSLLGVVADALLTSADETSSNSLDHFSELVAALSDDSGLPEREVQSLLVERMLKDPRCGGMNRDVIRLDDYRHLVHAN